MDAQSINGLFILNKPAGITSFEAVDAINKKFHFNKIGHSGTLDPLASGVLLVCANKATKLIEYLQYYDKEYYVEAQLGYISDTYDIQGNVKKFADIQKFNISQEIIKNLLETKFSGDTIQIIPPYSAAKHLGRTTHTYTKKNINIKKEKKVIIHSYNNIKYKDGLISFNIKINKGTYVRSIINDLGVELQTGAIVTKLIRLKNGPFELKEAKNINELTLEDIIPFDNLLNNFPTYIVKGITLKRIINGTKVLSFYIIPDEKFSDFRFLKIIDEKNRFISIGKISRTQKFVKPEKVFLFQFSEAELKEIASWQIPSKQKGEEAKKQIEKKEDDQINAEKIIEPQSLEQINNGQAEEASSEIEVEKHTPRKRRVKSSVKKETKTAKIKKTVKSQNKKSKSSKSKLSSFNLEAI